MENKDITRNNQNSVENIDCDKNCQPSTVYCQLNKRIALFPGTFDPFTIGHQSLVSRGLALVDEIIISIAFLYRIREWS